MSKIKDFTDLVVWKKAHELVLLIYKEVKAFPKSEKYALSNQLRRSAVSVTSNIAEGFSRQSKKEKIQFYYIDAGSLTELRNQLIIAKDVGFIDKDDYAKLNSLALEVGKMIYGLIGSIKKS